MIQTNALISEAKKIFLFLKKDYGFDEPTVEQTLWQAFVTFRKATTGIFIEVDWRDTYVGMSLEWKEKGSPTPRIARLHELLTERGYKSPTVKKGKRKRMTAEQRGEWFAKALSEYLEEQATLLRQYAQDILHG